MSLMSGHKHKVQQSLRTSTAEKKKSVYILSIKYESAKKLQKLISS